MASRGVGVGTRDWCRHCEQKIIYLKDPDDGRFVHYRWQHMLPGGKHKEQCAPRFQDPSVKSEYHKKKALPKSYCWENMESGRYGWHSVRCERRVKDKTLFMCGIHANSVKKQRERTQRYNERWELNDFMRDGMDKVKKHLLEEFGLEVTVVYSTKEIPGHYTGEVMVDATALLNLLTEMRDEERF